METTSRTSALTEWRQGWGVVLSGAMGMALASTTVYSVGIFMAPLEKEFQWTRAEISAGLTINTVLAVLVSPFIGLLLDRIGVRRIGVVGVVLFCSIFACLSFAGPSIWSWWLLWLLLGMVGLCIKPTVWTTSVTSLFSSSRGLALSVMLCGTGLGSSLTPMVGNYLIEALGWRQGIMGLAAFWFLLVAPPVLLFLTSAKDRQRAAERKPDFAQGAPVAELPGVSVRDGLMSWRFVRLALAGFLTCLVVVSFVANLVPILSDRGFTRQQAANLAGIIGFATVTGRLVGGYLLDRVNGNMVGAVSVGLAIIPASLLLAFPGSVVASGLAVLILGLSLGAELDAVAYLATRHFGLRNFGALFGTISGLLAFATGLGPLLVSYSFDLTRSYDLALMVYLPMSVIAAIMFASLGRYPDFSKAQAVPKP